MKISKRQADGVCGFDLVVLGDEFELRFEGLAGLIGSGIFRLDVFDVG